ncbi:MAG: class I SAM-dependent methyltransferase [Dehalococcoidia bacterium]
MSGVYDPAGLSRFYDAYGETEWMRLERDLQGRISYAIHLKLLDLPSLQGLRVADLGCGPGRFAIDMLRAGARVTLGDISPTQLATARHRITDAGLLDGVESAHELDICDLSPFGDGAFDIVVCYGGALSYVRERHEEALAELVRVLRPGGRLVISVMSLYGTLALAGTLDAVDFLVRMEAHIPSGSVGDLPGLLLTVPGSTEFHQPIALFSASYLRDLVESAGCKVERVAAANPISRIGSPLTAVSADAEATRRLLELELALCEAPGVLDMGAHIVLSATRRG